jgi:phospholipid/cholesterol/gamma-HCH transport system permease protein
LAFFGGLQLERDRQQCFPCQRDLAQFRSAVNFIEAAHFDRPTDKHVRQGARARRTSAKVSQRLMSTATSNPSANDRPRGLSAAVYESIADLGAVVIRWVEILGDMTIFTLQTFSWLVARLPRRETLIPAFYNIGVLSLPVVALTGTFIGMVLAVQTYAQFKQFGFETRLGALINLSMCRELGPVLAATMLAGRVGSAIAAEIGTMRVTEQIDAMISMGANPLQYLVVPRFLACLLMIPSLTIMAIFMGVVGGWLYSVQVFDIDSYHYWNNSQQFVDNWDLFYGVFKSVFFGATIAIVSCYRGFHCAPGAEGVGRAATAAFVLSFVIIIMLDLFLSIALDQVHDLVWPQMVV